MIPSLLLNTKKISICYELSPMKVPLNVSGFYQLGLNEFIFPHTSMALKHQEILIYLFIPHQRTYFH